jgi:hypothetical protein
MAIGKTAGCMIMAGVAWVSAAQFTVRHEHWRKGCEGVLTVDENGVSFSGPGYHAWRWAFQEIQELQLAPRSIHILTYKDSRLRLGAGERYEFTGDIPADGLYALLRDRMDQRFVAQLEQGHAMPGLTLPVKHQARILGSEGTLAFTPDSIVYSTDAKNQSRTWRYTDIDGISSSARFQLTITTLEKSFNFQLKQPITEASYNQIWLEIEKKNGRIQ